MGKTKVIFYSNDLGRTVWEGKMNHVPSVGDVVLVNNTKHRGYYKVTRRVWNVDDNVADLLVENWSL
jgi:hypothetical protein